MDILITPAEKELIQEAVQRYLVDIDELIHRLNLTEGLDKRSQATLEGYSKLKSRYLLLLNKLERG